LTGDISEGIADCLKFSETSTHPIPPRSPPPLQALQFAVPQAPQHLPVQVVQAGYPIFPQPPSPSPSPSFQSCGWEIFDGTIADIKRKRAISFSEIYGPSSREASVTLSLAFGIKVDIYSRDSFLIEH
jgi:hypothetical protein